MKISRLQSLATVYRTMPYGGAILSISHSKAGSWLVADGMCVKADFLTQAHARASLRVAGFEEVRSNQFKLTPLCAHVSPEAAAAFGLDRLAQVAPHLVKIDLPNAPKLKTSAALRCQDLQGGDK